MLKSVYVVAYLTIAIIVTIQSVLDLFNGAPLLPTLGVLLTSAPITLTIGQMMVLNNKARTPDKLNTVAVLSLVGLVITTYHYYGAGGDMGPLSVAALMTGLYYLYDYWYARLDRTASNVKLGAPLPAFALTLAGGETMASDDLKGSPSILLFYRGNWCPLCVAQIKELAARYNELKQQGVRVLLVSPQSQRHTKSIAAKFDAAMEFAEDAGNEAAKALGIENQFGTPFGMQALGYKSHTVMPTVIILDADGVVQWVHETDNYRVRPEPDTFFTVLREKKLIPAD